MEAGLETKPHKNLLSRQQNADIILDMKRGNIFFLKVTEFKHLGTRVTNQILIHEKFKGEITKLILPTIQPSQTFNHIII
jgi:hypothetical protein